MAITWSEDGKKKERKNTNRGHVASTVKKIPSVSILEQLKSGKELDEKVRKKKYGYYSDIS